MAIIDVLRQTSLGACVTLALLYLLTQRELFQVHGGLRAQRVARVTTIVSTPVLMLFILVVGIRILDLLRIW